MKDVVAVGVFPDVEGDLRRSDTGTQLQVYLSDVTVFRIRDFMQFHIHERVKKTVKTAAVQFDAVFYGFGRRSMVEVIAVFDVFRPVNGVAYNITIQYTKTSTIHLTQSTDGTVAPGSTAASTC